MAKTENPVRNPLSVLLGDTAYSHNCLYRGKNLGNTVTPEQYAAINAGTFEDLYIGDFWNINDIKWRIAHFDYWYRCGDRDCLTHHAVIVPDIILYNAQMHNTASGTYEPGGDANTTVGGYVGSDMYKTNLARAKDIINNAFGSDHVLKYREYLTNAVSNGKTSGGSWYDSTVELMTENMVYGSHIFAPVSDGLAIPYNHTINRSQLALFAYCTDLIHARRSGWFWLRDVVSSRFFAYVNDFGSAHSNLASNAFGVRPAFPIH